MQSANPLISLRDELRFFLDYYPMRMKYSALIAFQYRVGTFLWVIGLIIEPVIYLVIWTTVANEQGGSVGSYSANDFVAYYLVWTILRIMNIGLNPVSFEWRVKNGQWSQLLLKPIHPIHDDIAFLLGRKWFDLLILAPMLIVLGLIFNVSLSLTWWQIVAFVIACLLGFLLRTMWQWALGLTTFWIIRVSAIFDLYFALELLLSGRIVPLDLLPEWAQTAAFFLPYQWSFAFPIEVAIGRETAEQTIMGIGIQIVWLLIGSVLVRFMWRRGVRRYSAVGA